MVKFDKINNYMKDPYCYSLNNVLNLFEFECLRFNFRMNDV